MATVVIRNLEDKTVRRLKAKAKQQGRSLEAELREILQNEARRQERMQRFLAEADRIAAMTPAVPQTDSALLIREDRDR